VLERGGGLSNRFFFSPGSSPAVARRQGKPVYVHSRGGGQSWSWEKHELDRDKGKRNFAQKRPLYIKNIMVLIRGGVGPPLKARRMEIADLDGKQGSFWKRPWGIILCLGAQKTSEQHRRGSLA